MFPVNRCDVVDFIYAYVGTLTVAQSRAVVRAFQDTVIEALQNGYAVRTDIGTFKVRERQERIGKNPKTGEAITIPAHRVPVLDFATDVKEVIAGQRHYFSS